VDARSRPGLRHGSGNESDRYKELLVNPALLVLATQRGNIDCGGLWYLIVGYGHFHQLVVPAAAGHVSVTFELASSPADHLQAIVPGLMACPAVPRMRRNVDCISPRWAARRSRHRGIDLPGKNRQLPERWAKPCGFRAATYAAGSGTEQRDQGGEGPGLLPLQTRRVTGL
jgi:hypothetical protein